MSRIPIRLRVTLAFALVMAVVLAALGYFVYARFDSELSEQIDQSLRSHGDDIASLVAGGDLRTEREAARAGGELRPGAHSRRTASTRPPRSSGPTPQLTPAEAAQRRAGSFIVTAAPCPQHRRRGAAPGAARARAARRDLRRRHGRFARRPQRVARQPEDAASDRRTRLPSCSPRLAGYAVSGRALRPVEAMRRRAAAISAAEPEQRLPLPEADDEIRRLGETLNEMLGRLEAALERERAFVDDASHELRTPLAMHKTELELALRYAKTPEEMRAAIASAIVEVDRLIAARRGSARPGALRGGQAGPRPAPRWRRRSCSGMCASASRRAWPTAGRSLVVEPAGRSDGRGRSGCGSSRRSPTWSRTRSSTAAGRSPYAPASRGGGGCDPRRGPRARVPAGVHRPRLRALQPGRRLAWRRGHRARPRDRRGDRPRAPGQRPRRQPRRRAGRTSGSSFPRSPR